MAFFYANVGSVGILLLTASRRTAPTQRKSLRFPHGTCHAYMSCMDQIIRDATFAFEHLRPSERGRAVDAYVREWIAGHAALSARRQAPRASA